MKRKKKFTLDFPVQEGTLTKKLRGKHNLLYEDCCQSIEQYWNHTCMAVNPSGSQVIQEKIHAQEDSDSDF